MTEHISENQETLESLAKRVPAKLRADLSEGALKQSLEKALALVEQHPTDDLILLKEADEPFLFPLTNGQTLENVFSNWTALSNSISFFEPIGKRFATTGSIPRRTKVHRFWVNYFLKSRGKPKEALDFMCAFHTNREETAAQMAALIDVLQVRDFPAQFAKPSMQEFDQIVQWAETHKLDRELYNMMFNSADSVTPPTQTLLHVLLFKIRPDRKASPIPENTSCSRILRGSLPHVISVIRYFLENGKIREAAEDAQFLKKNLPYAYSAFVSSLMGAGARDIMYQLRISQEDATKAKQDYPEPVRFSADIMKNVRDIEVDINTWNALMSEKKNKQHRKGQTPYKDWKGREERFAKLTSIERIRSFTVSYRTAENPGVAAKIAQEYLATLFAGERPPNEAMFAIADLAKEYPVLKVQLLQQMEKDKKTFDAVCEIASRAYAHTSAGAIWLLAEYCKRDKTGARLRAAVPHFLTPPQQLKGYHYRSVQIHRRLFGLVYLLDDFDTFYPHMLAAMARMPGLLDEAPTTNLKQFLTDKVHMLGDFDLHELETYQVVSDIEGMNPNKTEQLAREVIEKRDIPRWARGSLAP